MHEDSAERFPGRLAVNTGQDPESLLINGKGQFRDPNTGFMTNTPLEVFTMTPGKRYRFRMINSFCTVCPAQLTIEGHGLTVIATDGEPVHPGEDAGGHRAGRFAFAGEKEERERRKGMDELLVQVGRRMVQAVLRSGDGQGEGGGRGG